jgi:hypothetical protein
VSWGEPNCFGLFERSEATGDENGTVALLDEMEVSDFTDELRRSNRAFINAITQQAVSAARMSKTLSRIEPV